MKLMFRMAFVLIGRAPVAPSTVPSPNAARDNEMRWLVVRENMRRFATGAKMYSVFDLARGF